MNDTHGLGTDLRAALRFCTRSPLTSVAVILTLAIGVGANTAVFSVVNARFFKPLPIANANRLVEIDDRDGGSFTYPEYLDARNTPGLSALVAGGRTSTTMGEGHARRRIVIDMVTANYFTALGAGGPALGRLGPEPREFDDFQRRLRAHLQSMAGVAAAGIVTGRPLASVRRGPLRVEGMTAVPRSKPMSACGPPPPPPPRGAMPLEKLWFVSHSYVSPGLFASLALPIVRGRDFTDADRLGAPRVAIVNESLAAQAFGKNDPIGRRVAWASGKGFDIEIVGVVRDFRSEHLREAAPDAIFFPVAHLPSGETHDCSVTGVAETFDVTLVLRGTTAQSLDRDRLTQHMIAFDRRLFVDRIWTFDEEAGRALSQERLLATAGSILSGIALALLVVGVYGAFASAVVRGRRELGIRLALGATPHVVGRMVVARSLGVALVGVLIGLPFSYAFTRSFAHLLYGVKPIEPLVAAATVAIVLATAAVSAFLPARKAAQVDPLIALRSE
jgi:hypothetical protein